MLRYYLTLTIALCAGPLLAKPSLVQQAVQAFEKNDLAAAQGLIEQAVSQEATQGKTWYYRGAIYEKLLRKQITTEEAPKLFEETLAAYRQALALTPTASQYHSFAQINLNNLWAYYLDRGRRYYRQEAFDKAIEQWKYAQQIKADEPCVALYTAIAAQQNEQYALARQHYTQYLAQTPVAPAAVYRALGRLTAELDKAPQKGLQLIEQGLLHYPFEHDLLYERLALYKALEQEEVLPKLLGRKIAAAPQEAAYHYQLAYWYEQQGEPTQALKQYQKAAQLAPDRIEPLRQQGLLHYNRAAQLTQEIQEMPEEEFQKKGTGLKQVLARELEQALSYFEGARRLQPRDPLTLQHLQTLYLRLQKPTQAARLARKLAQ